MDLRTFVFDITRDYVTDCSATLGVPITNRLLGAVRARDIPFLASCTTYVPHAMQVGRIVRPLLQVEGFFNKNTMFSDAVSCSDACRNRFFEAEDMCRETNQRLDQAYCSEQLSADFRLTIDRACRYIERVLGPFNTFMEEIPYLVRLTAGATSTTNRKLSIPPLKLKRRLEVTPSSVPYVKALSDYFGYANTHWKMVVTNRVEEVPKSWKTNRTIACEPVGVLPFQLAFDSYAKERFRYFGIDLSDQTRNQWSAYIGSIGGGYSTIDLSMASDTVAFNTVAWLFPEPWFRYLSAMRSPFASGTYGTFKYEKFSSMGNGSTFAIETLIFASFCYAVGSQHFTVYGDDITIESQYVPALNRLLQFFGFVPNEDKSFTFGPFRESCGTYWFNGRNVTPFRIETMTPSRAKLSHNVNGLASVSVPDGRVWDRLRSLREHFHLPLAPFSERTEAGVHVDVHTAYREKLIRIRPRGKYAWIPMYKSYQPVRESEVTFNETRGYILWHLEKFRKKPILVEDGRVRSWDPHGVHKYVRRWVRWNPPTSGIPAHLWVWSDFLTRGGTIAPPGSKK